MRLTADLILRAPTFENCLKQRELDLRGNPLCHIEIKDEKEKCGFHWVRYPCMLYVSQDNGCSSDNGCIVAINKNAVVSFLLNAGWLIIQRNKIPFIENLGATKDEYEAIDLSDNDIGKLDNFPLLKRLVQLFVNNNRISKIADLSKSLPSLHTLSLCNNRISKIGDLSLLRTLTKLTTLALSGNPVTKEPNYRLYVIHLVPNLHYLDFQRIKIAERRKARELFGTSKKPTKKGKTFDPNAPVEHSSAFASEELMQRMRIRITEAESMEEVMELEQALASGNDREIEKALQKKPARTAEHSSNNNGNPTENLNEGNEIKNESSESYDINGMDETT